MEGRSADEAYEKHLIAQMTDGERAAGFRLAVEASAEKWLQKADVRRSLRTALDYTYVVASAIFDAEVRRCALAEEVVRVARRIEGEDGLRFAEDREQLRSVLATYDAHMTQGSGQSEGEEHG